MARYPPTSYYTSTDPLPWDDPDNSHYNYLDPADRDEYDDFANETSRPYPNLPHTNVTVTPAGSIRTSYQNPRAQTSRYSSQYDSQGSQHPVTPPRQTYVPDRGQYDSGYGEYYNQSPERSNQDYQRGSSRPRTGSPTRIPLTGGAGAAYGGYAMSERKPGQFGGAPKSAWLREEQKSLARRKWIIIALIIFLILGAVVGVTIYFVKFRNTGSSGGNNTGSSDGRNGFGATSTDLKKDPRLKKMFDGMDYTPLNAQYPGCGCIQPNITADVAILSQLTSKIRLYGTDCDQATMVLDAIQYLKVNVTVFVGVWVDNNSTTLNRQLNAMYDIVKKYPTNLIEGIAVGNEVLFRQDMTETQLISLIQQVRTNITSLNLGRTLPICTSDLGSNWSPTLSAAVDCVMANIHPFFSGIDVNEAATWTLQFLTTNVVPTTANLSPKPNIIISEVGWPSGGGSINSSVAGIDELQYFINTFPGAAKDAGVSYYWFEGYDEPWKIIYDTPTASYEDKWGLLDVNGYLKDGITLPSSVG